MEPGPVLLLTTVHKGQNNVMALPWHTMMEFEPPLEGCVVSNRDFSFTGRKGARECVRYIPTADLVQKVVDCGNSTGRCVDKFVTFGLTQESGAHVGAPSIAECYARMG